MGHKMPLESKLLYTRVNKISLNFHLSQWQIVLLETPPPQSGLRRIFPSLRKEGSFYCAILTLYTLLFTVAMTCSSSALEACIRLMAIVAPSGERNVKYHFPSKVELLSYRASFCAAVRILFMQLV